MIAARCRSHRKTYNFLGFLPHDNALIEADLKGISPYAVDSPAKAAVREMVERL